MADLNPMRRCTAALRLWPALALSCALALTGCDSARPSFKSVDITGAEYARQFSLTDTEGKTRTLADYLGKVVVVFFGYTQCPDVCPTTMTELAEVKRSLGADGKRVQGIFVTVDPQRDTAELLHAYLANFGPDIAGLRGTPEQTQAVAREFKIFYSKSPGPTETSYSIDHTAGSYVIDARGRVRLFTRYGSGAKMLAADLKILLAETS